MSRLFINRTKSVPGSLLVLVISDLIFHLCIIRQNLYVNHAVSSGTGEILSIIRFYVSPGPVPNNLHELSIANSVIHPQLWRSPCSYSYFPVVRSGVAVHRGVEKYCARASQTVCWPGMSVLLKISSCSAQLAAMHAQILWNQENQAPLKVLS